MQTDCTVYMTMDLIAKRWSMLVLLEMHRAGGGPRRFNEIKKGLWGITPKVLSARLKELEEAGLVTKNTVSSRAPLRAEYSLTDSGRDLITVIKGFKRWALRWKVDNPVCGSLDCAKCGT